MRLARRSFLVCLLLVAAVTKADDRRDGPEGCDPKFQSQRRAPSWYPANHFGAATSCSEPKAKHVAATVSIPVYWLVAGTKWTAADARARLDEAVRWYAKYCITVPMYEIAVTPGDLTRIRKELSKADTGVGADYARAAARIFEGLWADRMSKPTQSLVVLFVDDFQQVEYLKGRVSSVSGNFGGIPLILIPERDSGATHIVTHELIHGLGKVITGKTSAPIGTHADNTWGDGGCPHGAADPKATPDMGHPSRNAGTGKFQNGDDDLMDWATYWEFLYQHNVK